jgi:hypothetical protein
MMSNNHSKILRILAISPSTRGFGFAVLDKPGTLVDWGVKSVKGDKNSQSIAKVVGLIDHYEPKVLVLPDHSTKQSRRSPRIKALNQELLALASGHNVKLASYSHEKVRRFFFDGEEGTKDAIAEILANRFPEELSFRLPPKRKPWMSEDYRMDIFDAVALIVVFLGK